MTENMLANNKKSLKIPKDVIRIGELKKDRHRNERKKKRTKRQAKIYKILHRKLKVKQRSTNRIHKTKDRATRSPLKTENELRCSRRISSSSFNSGTREVLTISVANP